MPRPIRPLALLLLSTLIGCDSSETGLSLNTFEATVSGARSATLRGRASAGPVTHVDETTYELLFQALPAGQILLGKRSLRPLAVGTYAVGGAGEQAFSGVLGVGVLSPGFALFAVESGSVVVERVAGREVEGRLRLVARSFEGDEEVRVEGAFRVRAGG